MGWGWGWGVRGGGVCGFESISFFFFGGGGGFESR